MTDKILATAQAIISHPQRTAVKRPNGSIVVQRDGQWRRWNKSWQEAARWVHGL